jgi:hypothetical protein
MANELTPEERFLLDAVESGEWVSLPNLNQEIKRYQDYATVQSEKLEEIKVELPSRDLQFLQKLAIQSGVTLPEIVANLVHQFVVSNIRNDHLQKTDIL